MFDLSPQSTKPASQMTLSQTLPTIELAAPVANICDAVPEPIGSEAACPEVIDIEHLDTSVLEPEAIAQKMANFQAEIPAKSDGAALERELSSFESQDIDDNQGLATQSPQVSAEVGCDQLLGTSETSMLVGTW